MSLRTISALLVSRSSAWPFFAALCLLTASPAADAQSNLLINGDAETGDTSGWIDPLTFPRKSGHLR